MGVPAPPVRCVPTTLTSLIFCGIVVERGASMLKSPYTNHFRCVVVGLLKLHVVASILLSTFLLSSCGTTTQRIAVRNNGESLSVDGSGFGNISQCAQLILFSPPDSLNASQFVSMGLANCSGGVFSNFNWRFSYTTAPGSLQNCQLTSSWQNAVVIAVDQGSNPPSQFANQQISFAWGPNCAFICGTIGQPACPSGCLEGVNSYPGSNGNQWGTCMACGGKDSRRAQIKYATAV